MVNVELTLVNFNKQRLDLWTSGDHLSVLFYATLSFSFFGFTLQARKKTFPHLLSKSYQRKKSIKRPDTHYTYNTFLMYSYILKILLLYLCFSVFLVSSLIFKKFLYYKYSVFLVYSHIFKGCFCYIFASLFFKSKREHLRN